MFQGSGFAAPSSPPHCIGVFCWKILRFGLQPLLTLDHQRDATSLRPPGWLGLLHETPAFRRD